MTPTTLFTFIDQPRNMPRHAKELWRRSQW